MIHKVIQMLYIILAKYMYFFEYLFIYHFLGSNDSLLWVCARCRLPSCFNISNFNKFKDGRIWLSLINTEYRLRIRRFKSALKLPGLTIDRFFFRTYPYRRTSHHVYPTSPSLKYTT